MPIRSLGETDEPSTVTSTLPSHRRAGVGHRPSRAALLAAAVAVGGASVFTATILRRAIQDSTSASLDRLGADLMVVPRAATVNLTSALLTGEPTDQTIDPASLKYLSALPGVNWLRHSDISVSPAPTRLMAGRRI